jgi:hypothetical protein
MLPGGTYATNPNAGAGFRAEEVRGDFKDATPKSGQAHRMVAAVRQGRPFCR